MRYRPINTSPDDPRLGRLIPDDWEHVERWPLTAAPPSKPVPVTIGVNWYEAFDNPERDSRGRWWIGRGQLGSIRGGHCVALEPGDDALRPHTNQDLPAWWAWYDQGREGACVGFGSSRMMSLLNRKRYFARWLWDRATVRAAMDVLRARGHVTWSEKYADLNDQPSDSYPRSGLQPVAGEGIAANRWATDVDTVRAALQSPADDRMGAVRILNSWGTSYPHRVWLPFETLQRLLDEDGEAACVTDR